MRQTLCHYHDYWLLLFQQLVTSCKDGARRMEWTEQMYTIQKQMDFGKIKVIHDWNRFHGGIHGGDCEWKQTVLTWTDDSCDLAAVSSVVIIEVAEEARWAGRLHWRAQHLEGFQPQELLPVSLQWCADRHQEEEVGETKMRVNAVRFKSKIRVCGERKYETWTCTHTQLSRFRVNSC